MRRLSARLVRNLQPPASDGDVIPEIGQALSRVRGRPVRLRSAAFPPATASGLWVDRISHDLIAYEENTDREHQLVIIGHEAWHMFQGHCGSVTHHGPGASRAGVNEETVALAKLMNVISDVVNADLLPAGRMDAALHVATRTDTRQVEEEVDAERFGFRFATDVQAVLEEARSSADPQDLAGRIQASMAHRFRRT
ncbi:toxin-antitoxin system, toxin component [Streptomyces sp. NPDC051000]|uniref:toxin-antitoxin system, toxin component n=1 Tax=Streptomyces sp. NPDC051000 TaxID=3155520 RepID=UPI0034052506